MSILNFFHMQITLCRWVWSEAIELELSNFINTSSNLNLHNSVFYPFLQCSNIVVHCFMKAQKTCWLYDIQLTNWKRHLKTACHAKNSCVCKNCKALLKGYRYDLSWVSQQECTNSDDKSYVFAMQWYKVMLCMVWRH